MPLGQLGINRYFVDRANDVSNQFDALLKPQRIVLVGSLLSNLFGSDAIPLSSFRIDRFERIDQRFTNLSGQCKRRGDGDVGEDMRGVFKP